MIDRGNSMGPHGGNRPPLWCLPRDSAARPDCRRAHRLPARTGSIETRYEFVAGSVADHAGRDRYAPGYNPAERMIRPMRTDKMISAALAADDRIAGCS